MVNHSKKCVRDFFFRDFFFRLFDVFFDFLTFFFDFFKNVYVTFFSDLPLDKISSYLDFLICYINLWTIS